MPSRRPPRLAAMVANVRASATFCITMQERALRRAGTDVIEMSAGETDLDTPRRIKAAAVGAMRKGHTRYTPVDGIPELKEAVARKFRLQNGLDYRPKEITVANGTKQVIFNALLAIIEPGDEVLMPVPYWPSYPEIVRLAGGTSKYFPIGDGVSTSMAHGVAATIGPATRCVILNFPSKPTGRFCGPAELRELADVLLRHPDVWIIVDNIYEHFSYTETAFAMLASVEPALGNRMLTVSGVSKSYAMTGWRIGFAAGPESLVRAMGTIQGQTTSNPCSISQWAAVEALNGPNDFLAGWRELLRTRRDRLFAAMDGIRGLQCRKPHGAFYLFPNIAPCLGATTPLGTRIATDQDFAMALLSEAGVAVVPGSEFGAPGFFRASFTAAEETLVEAGRRIRAFVGALEAKGDGMPVGDHGIHHG